MLSYCIVDYITEYLGYKASEAAPILPAFLYLLHRKFMHCHKMQNSVAL